MVAANPLATQASYQVLKARGSAVDAAIAVQMVLALVEPQSSGLGSGAFLVHYDGQATEVFDGRETAPALATETRFVGQDGKPLPFIDAVVGGTARSARLARCACWKWFISAMANCPGRGYLNPRLPWRKGVFALTHA